MPPRKISIPYLHGSDLDRARIGRQPYPSRLGRNTLAARCGEVTQPCGSYDSRTGQIGFVALNSQRG